MIDKAKDIIKNSDAILVYAGSGMSASSSLPVFRGDDGFWSNYPECKKLGIRFIDIANPDAFYENLELAQGFYLHRLRLYRDAEPHAGYYALKEAFSKKKYGGWFVTTNVDNHAFKAGLDNVYEEHGSIEHWHCSNEKCDQYNYSKTLSDNFTIKDFKAEYSSELFCSKCSSHLRPAILMFGDYQFNCKIKKVEQSGRFQRFYYNLQDRGAKVAVLEIGAGSSIPTMRCDASSAAKIFSNVPVIRINNDHCKSFTSANSIHLLGDSEELLLSLLAE